MHDGKGKYGLTIHEEQTHFALWAVMKSPLIIGADLSSIRNESLEILMNKELIAINQDPVGEQAVCFGAEGCVGVVQAFFGRLDGGARAVVVTNWNVLASDSHKFKLSDIDLKLDKGMKAVVTDCFNATFSAEITDEHEAFDVGRLETHQSRALRFELKVAETEEEVEL